MLVAFALTLNVLYYVSAIGVCAIVGIGYWRNTNAKTAQAAAQTWRDEHEAEKTRADRLAQELAATAAELRVAEARTDITKVLELLQVQHREATDILTRIADESAARNGHIAEVLAASQERVGKQHTETLSVLARMSESAAEREKDIANIVSETLKTVAALRTIEAAAQELAQRTPAS